MAEFDAIVIGGGLVGAAVAYGLARRGQKPLVLDEGDIAHRASRGNFGLVWVQSKGFGVPEYQRWTRRSSEDWAEFSRELLEATGIASGHERPGGVTICLTEDELEKRRQKMAQLHLEAGETNFEYEILGHDELKKLLPAIGPDVVGATYTRYDGHANPLYTLRALHAGLVKLGGRYVPNARVEAIRAAPNHFTINAGGATFAAPRLVLGAGLGNKELGEMVGLDVPVRPVRGQIIVTERMQPFLPLPTLMIRQTVEGTIMIGESREEAGFDDTTSVEIVHTLAERAVKTFPVLRHAKIVRTWGALRVMSADGLPVYEQSKDFPGAFVCTCHSGVTLAAAHALHYAKYVIDGALPPELARFSTRRFHVRAAA
ncbi:MAG: FAD-binding oxidoreductase [Betaproteobacteria bacterium]|nr:MAG: FAD-binding oxidoreductase [Betaproteobacteria bacterium]